jgi:outer membrane protein TolC
LAAREKVKITFSKYKQTKAWINPEIEFEVSKFPADFDKDPRINYREIEGELKYLQPFEAWGKRGLKLNIVQHEIEQMKAELQNRWIDVARRVKEQYTETLLHQKNVGLAEENLDLSRRFLDQVLVRFNSGEALRYEVSRAKLEEKRSRNDLMSAQKQVLIDYGKMNVLMGREMTAPILLADSFSIENMDKSFEDLLEIALSQRQDIYIQEKEIEKNDLEVKLAKRKRLPDFALKLFAERDDEMYSGGIGIIFELPLWNQFGPDIEKAKLTRELSQIDFESLKNDVSLEVYISFQEADLARETVEIYDEAMKEANEILRLSNLGYGSGEITFLSYLESLTVYRKTKQTYYEAVSNYARKLAILEQAIGYVREYKEEETNEI